MTFIARSMSTSRWRGIKFFGYLGLQEPPPEFYDHHLVLPDVGRALQGPPTGLHLRVWISERHIDHVQCVVPDRPLRYARTCVVLMSFSTDSMGGRDLQNGAQIPRTVTLMSAQLRPSLWRLPKLLELQMKRKVLGPSILVGLRKPSASLVVHQGLAKVKSKHRAGVRTMRLRTHLECVGSSPKEFTDEIRKLTRNTSGDLERKTVRLTMRMSKVVGLAGAAIVPSRSAVVPLVPRNPGYKRWLDRPGR
ncbi:hypothetical protein BHE74_00057512 [Ensete ventricosum]|nr:hypothetical protein BHE74_00057512 [Ensete ventricosum]